MHSDSRKVKLIIVKRDCSMQEEEEMGASEKLGWPRHHTLMY